MTTKDLLRPWMVRAFAGSNPSRVYRYATRGEMLAKVRALKADSDIDHVWAGVHLVDPPRAGHYHLTGWRRTAEQIDDLRMVPMTRWAHTCSERLAELRDKHRGWDHARRVDPETRKPRKITPAYHGPRQPTWRRYVEREARIIKTMPAVESVTWTPLQIEVE